MGAAFHAAARSRVKPRRAGRVRRRGSPRGGYAVGVLGIMSFLYFLVVGAVCTVIEYTIAEILEYKYGMQLWDYTDNIVNFRGKISLLSSLAFAGGCMALAYLVEPLYRLIVTHKVPRHAYDAVACALLTGL